MACDALTIHEAAETTGWSPRMLRYIERSGLVEPARSASGYRLYGPAELQRLRTLRELLERYDLGLSDVGFALRLRREAELRDRGRGLVRGRAAPPRGRRRRRLAALGAGEARAAAHRRRTAHLNSSQWRRHMTHDRRFSASTDFKVADLSLADFGRKEIQPRRARDARPDVDPRASTPTRSRSRARASPARCT